MVGFFKYLTGGYGGKMMPKNAVEHVYHVHIMINTISRDSDDIYFLVKKKGLYISDIRGTLSFNGKKLTSGMLKSYLKSVRLFSTSVHHDFASGKASQNFQRKNAQVRESGKKTSAKPYIVRLPYKRPQAWWRGHDCIRGRGHQSLLQVKVNSESNKSSGGRIRWRCNYQSLGDYQVFRLILEHGSRPGPLESMKKDLFEKAVEHPTNADIVDEEKTSRHYGLAKYSYMKIYKENIRPNFCNNQE